MSCSRKSENGANVFLLSAAIGLEPVVSVGVWQSRQPIFERSLELLAIAATAFAMSELVGRWRGAGASNVMKFANWVMLVPSSSGSGVGSHASSAQLPPDWSGPPSWASSISATSQRLERGVGDSVDQTQAEQRRGHAAGTHVGVGRDGLAVERASPSGPMPVV